MALGDKYTLLPSSARQSALHSARASLVPRSCLTLLDWRFCDSHAYSLPLASVFVGQAILHNTPYNAGQVGSGGPERFMHVARSAMCYGCTEETSSRRRPGSRSGGT